MSPARRLTVTSILGLALSVSGCVGKGTTGPSAGSDGNGNRDASVVGGSSGASGTGGASGGGGSGGTGGSNAPQPCDKLPAPGMWENIEPVFGDLHAEPNAIVLDPLVAGTIWMGTHGSGDAAGAHRIGGLFKSTDCGATWKQISTGANSKNVNGGDLWSMAIDPVAPSIIYAVGGYGAYGLWKSTNGGVDWASVFPPDSMIGKVVNATFVKSISIDASNHQHVVASMHANCLAPYDASCHAESTDGGASWVLMRNPMGDPWAEDTPSFALDGNSILYSDVKGLFLTSDHGVSWKRVGDMVWGASHRALVPASDGFYYLPGSFGILRSKDATSWSVVPNSGGKMNDVATGGGLIFSGDPDSRVYQMASLSNLSSWTKIPPPTSAKYGAQQIDYDEVHHLLYSSNFSSGLWRMVIQQP